MIDNDKRVVLDPGKIYDLMIIGCGPAGLSAAVNARIREKDFVLFGSGESCLAKVNQAPRVDNYLGFYNIGGQELGNSFMNHIEKMNISIHNERVDMIYPGDKKLYVMCRGEIYSTKGVILATGISVAKYLPGEKELLGKGISYCATCDGALYRGKKVVVIGETQEAQEDANFLAEIAGSVVYISRHGKPDKLKKEVQIQEYKPLRVVGDAHFAELETDGGTFAADGLFIIREVTPVQEILQGLEIEGSLIKVDRNMATNIPGVFAAGDCTGQPFQLAKAVGEGLVAALNAVRYIDRLNNS